jgi:hypothetical protein
MDGGRQRAKSKISAEDAEEFTRSLGQIVGGSWRQVALGKRLGVPKALGLSVDDWVNKRLGGYVRLAVEERRQAVAELKAEGDSTRDIASTIGVSDITVRRDMDATNVAPAEPTTSGQVEAIATNVALAPLDAVAALAVTAPADKPHVANNSGENEWYTPPEYIEAARLAMGRIDCDPASSSIANRRVKAERFFTADDNGLAQKWHGAVWMNPPYAQPLIAHFAEAVAAKFEAREIEQACVLVNNGTETEWFQRMLAAGSAACFTRSRVRFLDPQGNPGAPLQGQDVLYMGTSVADFAQAFQSFGIIWTRANGTQP